MIRGSLCLILIVFSLFLATSGNTQLDSNNHSARLSPALGSVSHVSDPVNGTLYAFNATYAQFDLYTNKTAALSYGTFANNTRPIPGAPSGNLTWFSNIVNTQTGMPVNGTGFKFISNATGISQSINWTRINIPKGVGGNTYLRLDWNGTLPKGTSARYQLYNASSITPFLNVTKTGPPYPLTVSGGPPLNKTGGIPLSCGVADECFDVTKYMGFNITLAFIFNSNSTGKGIRFQVSNVEVASVATPFQSVSHFMISNPSNSTEVIHNADLPLTYNANVTYHRPNTSNGNLTHTWGQMVVTFYMPASYRPISIRLNGTIPLPLTYPISQGPCAASFCTNSQFIALNMTLSKTTTSMAVVQARSINAIKGLVPTILGVPTAHFVPGDSIAVRMTSSPGVNVSASQEISLVDPNGLVSPSPAPASNKGGTYLYNFTVPLSAKPGLWLVNGTFTSGYDFGFASQSFNVEEIQPVANTFGTNGGIGSNNGLNVTGTLVYRSTNQPAQNVNTTIFAVDSGASPEPVTSQGLKSTGLYIGNITLANGVFTVSQPLTMLFSVVNPTQPAQRFNATVTIEHEWYASQTHGVSTTFNLTLGDQPFTISSSAVYRADITISQTGIQLQVRSVTSPASPAITLTMSTGSSPVTSTRQHFGRFKVTVTSTNQFTRTTSTAPPVESPTYAFTLDSDLIPNRLLASSATVSTSCQVVSKPCGSFSVSIVSDRLLGAKNLVLFALGRDANGITMFGTNIQKNQKTSFFNDSTLLFPSADIPSDVATKQSVTITLNLKSNSTTIPQTLIVNLDLSGSGIVNSQTVTVLPGTTKAVSFTFPSPSNAGSYLLTFSSPDYLSGVPLLVKTLQVSILSSNLQILIPALIGLVVALVILGYYALKRGSRVTEEEEEEKPRPSGKPQKPQPRQQPTKSLTRS